MAYLHAVTVIKHVIRLHTVTNNTLATHFTKLLINLEKLVHSVKLQSNEENLEANLAKWFSFCSAKLSLQLNHTV